MTPTIGRIVIYTEGTFEGRGRDGTNGTRRHPAMITRVWSDTCVNLHVFKDAHESEVKSSVTMLPELPEGVADTSGNPGWSWPVKDSSHASTAMTLVTEEASPDPTA
jgi:hypothetical protein